MTIEKNIEDRARREIAELLGTAPGELDDAAPLFSVGVSSFRVVELVIELQESFGIRFCHDDMNAVETIGDLVRLIRVRVEASEDPAAA